MHPSSKNPNEAPGIYHSNKKVTEGTLNNVINCMNLAYYFVFQPSPWCFTMCILFTATLGNLPKFFEFFLIYDEDKSVPDYWTTDLYEDPRYIRYEPKKCDCLKVSFMERNINNY